MENAIAWIFIFPLFGAVACALLNGEPKVCYPVAVLSMAGATWAGVETLLQAVASPRRKSLTFWAVGPWIYSHVVWGLNSERIYSVV